MTIIAVYNKKMVLTALSLACLSLSMFLMLTVGTAAISLSDMAKTLVEGVVGMKFAEGVNPAYGTILYDIRWPRIALAVVTGSSLAVSGACYQAMFNNPLGDPFILGVSSGAALGAAIAIVVQQSAYVSIFAFAGGVITMFLVYCLGQVGSRASSIDSNRLLLAGVAFGSLLNALLCAIMALNTRQVTEILFWLMGSLANPPETLYPVTLAVVIGLIFIFIHARDLDIITTGDENAQFLGVDIARVRITVLLGTALITSVVVSVTGVIGFIGLIVPHIIRKICGPGHRVLLPLCAVWGAIFLLWADGITRMTPALSQIPVGVVTAMFGSPFFLYLLYLKGRNQG
ncbi:Hemin transport system permease protein HmuU [Sporomusa carbonis]|uniref:FecCD family ABC transporter permease n=1 Tax=Sporomusa carbonis TaxID=3076075 RepID=UPI003A69044F